MFTRLFLQYVRRHNLPRWRMMLPQVTKWRLVTCSSSIFGLGWFVKNEKSAEMKKYENAALAQFLTPAHNRPPCGYEGSTFVPNFNFPTVLEQDKWLDPKLHPWLEVDFTKNPELYLQKILDYCFDGNIKPNDVQNSFDMKKSKKWFHTPWQHTSSVGREAIKGPIH